MKVELRKVKIARHMSEETTAFTADLWVDGKHIGYAKNDGRGGANFIDHRYDGKGLNTRDEVRAFREWCTQQPPLMAYCFHKTEWGDVAMSDDTYIRLLLDDWEENQYVKRLCKNKTLFRLEGDQEREYRTYKGAYTPERAASIRERHPNVVEIINERFI